MTRTCIAVLNEDQGCIVRLAKDGERPEFAHVHVHQQVTGSVQSGGLNLCVSGAFAGNQRSHSETSHRYA